MDYVDWFFSNPTCLMLLGTTTGLLTGYCYGYDRGFSEAVKQCNDKVKQFELPGM